MYRFLIYFDIRRTDLLRCAIWSQYVGFNVFGRNKKPKKIDLLSISDSERIKVMREMRRKLQEKVIERKLLRSFVEAETLTINGEDVFNADEPLKGFTLPRDGRPHQRYGYPYESYLRALFQKR